MVQKEISVIIPTLNEERNISGCLDGIVGDPKIEIIISDGGSTDRTGEIAEQYKDVKIISSPMGRGGQMNAGALCAKGEILLFLHADCILSTEAILNIRDIFENNHIVGGAFKIKLLSDKFPYRLIEMGINFRSRVFKLPYGDQGLFVKSSVFNEMGGFHEMDICEDLDFIWRLKKHGKMAILNERIFSSVRRWENSGILRTTLRNQFLLASYVIKHKIFNSGYSTEKTF